MVVGMVLALALLGHRPAAAAPTTRTYAAGVWTLEVHRDSFTGRRWCEIWSDDVVIHHDTAIFDLGRHVNTDRAQYRIDGGAAHGVQELTIENARNGVFPERGWIDNPSRGEVALPVADVAGARRVYIRATPWDRPETYSVRRLGEVLRSADALGCPAARL